MSFRYYHPVTGNPLPSVTEIINIINKPYLVPWANSLGFKHINYGKYMDKVSDLGTRIHEVLYQMLLPENIGRSFTFSEDMQNSINGFDKFLKKHTLEMVKGEVSIYGDRYAGTIDFIGYLDGIPCILDFKTSNNFSPSMFLQLVAYENLLKFSDELKDFEVQEKYILKLSKKDNSYQIIPFRKELQSQFSRIFNICLLLHEEWIINGIDNMRGDYFE